MSLSGCNQVYIGLGSNLCNPMVQVEEAIGRIKAHPMFQLVRRSSLFESEPVSSIPQASYINAVVLVETEASLGELYQVLQSITLQMGQKPKPKDAPRIIDLDILFFGELSGVFGELQIPHPRWQERLFVLAPLAEVCDCVTVDDATYNVNDLLEKRQRTNKYWVQQLEGVTDVAMSHR